MKLFRRLQLSAIALLCWQSAFAQSSANVVKSDGDDIGLQIVGTITHSSGGANVALVKETDSGRVQAVKPGHNILKTYKVIEVKPKYIVIQKDQEWRIVFQSKFAGEFMDSNASRKGNLSSYKEEGFERSDAAIRMTAQYRDRLIKDDLSQVLMQATAIPFTRDGRVIGFQLLQIDKDSVYDKAGFQDQDIVTSINGQDLNNVAGAVNLLNSLRKESQIELEVLRNGAPRRMTINVD
jgi:type II secretion system protein C